MSHIAVRFCAVSSLVMCTDVCGSELSGTLKYGSLAVLIGPVCSYGPVFSAVERLLESRASFSVWPDRILDLFRHLSQTPQRTGSDCGFVELSWADSSFGNAHTWRLICKT